MLDARGDDHHAPAAARRAQADEEEKEKLAYRVHAQILAVVYCIGHVETDPWRRQKDWGPGRREATRRFGHAGLRARPREACYR